MLKLFRVAIAAMIPVIAYGCSQQQTAAQHEQEKQEQVQRAKHANDVIQTSLHICDLNGGLDSYFVGDESIAVKCVNGLSTYFYPNTQ
jgi:PBP1b-binding outer membrane lipoprotein LpoB